jgi:hypothetical protein
MVVLLILHAHTGAVAVTVASLLLLGISLLLHFDSSLIVGLETSTVHVTLTVVGLLVVVLSLLKMIRESLTRARLSAKALVVALV